MGHPVAFVDQALTICLPLGAGWRGSSGAGGGGGGGVAMNTSYSCQGDTLSLACPNNLVIKVGEGKVLNSA